MKLHRRIDADDNRHVPHRWLNRTGWARHLAGIDRSWLLSQTHPPKKGEKALAKVCWMVELVIWKAQRISTPQVVGYPAMNYINRREMGSDTNEKPFNARQTGKTMIKYANWWLAIVRYIWRTHELEEAALEGVEADHDEVLELAIQAVALKQRVHHRVMQALQHVRIALGHDAGPASRHAAFALDARQHFLGSLWIDLRHLRNLLHSALGV